MIKNIQKEMIKDTPQLIEKRNNFFKSAQELIETTRNHEKYRGKECLNLIASEGVKSPAIQELLSASQDLESRYSEGDNDLKGNVKLRNYQGQKYITKIENLTAHLIRELFDCNWVDIRPVSGTQANSATFKGLSMVTKNNKMVVTPLRCGGHISHDCTGLAGRIMELETINHAYDIEEMNIDSEKSAAIIEATRPGIVTFGCSLFPFPHPVKELVEVAKKVGAYIVFDAAHVLGLIAGGCFQNPLKEGADFVTSSTHKTFPGPQGGLILANLEGKRMEKAIKMVQNAVSPLTTANIHPGRLPALGLLALELKLWGSELAKQTIKNAQAAGNYLFENGLRVLGKKRGFTRSHQIVVDVRDYGGGGAVAENLERANIILNKTLLPYDDENGKENPSGIRIGFQDVTRRGFKEADIIHLCNLMTQAIKQKGKSSEVKEKVIELRQRFPRIKYGFPSISEAERYLREASV